MSLNTCLQSYKKLGKYLFQLENPNDTSFTQEHDGGIIIGRM